MAPRCLIIEPVQLVVTWLTYWCWSAFKTLTTSRSPGCKERTSTSIVLRLSAILDTSSPVTSFSVATNRMGGLDIVRDTPAPRTITAVFSVRTTLEVTWGPLQFSPVKPASGWERVIMWSFHILFEVIFRWECSDLYWYWTLNKKIVCQAHL